MAISQNKELNYNLDKMNDLTNKMYDDKLIDLDDKVVTYLPQFKGQQKKYFNHKSNISIKHLLTHSSGLPPFRKYFLMDEDKESVLDSLYNTEPIHDLEEKTIYSDVGIIILGKIVFSKNLSYIVGSLINITKFL